MPKLPTKVVNYLVNGVLAILSLVRLNSPNRIVVALSPFFTAAAGYLLALAARYLPFIGHKLSTAELTGLFVAGAFLASTKILMWLRGWQAHEKASVATHRLLTSAATSVGSSSPTPAPTVASQTVPPVPGAPPMHQVGTP